MSKKIFVECVKCEVSEVGPGEGVVNTSIEFVKDGATKWITVCECEGLPTFYLTDEDIFNRVVEMDCDDEFLAYIESHTIDEFEGIRLGEYEEIEEALSDNFDSDAAMLIRYIMDVTQCDMDELDMYLEAGTKKFVEDIIITSSDGIDFGGMNEETVYKTRLFLEGTLQNPGVYDGAGSEMNRLLQRDLMTAKKLSGSHYEEWRSNYITEQMIKLKGEKFITVHYLFAGIGSFDETMLEAQLDSFKCWINGNGSAFMSEPRLATKEEIMIYIAKNAAD